MLFHNGVFANANEIKISNIKFIKRVRLFQPRSNTLEFRCSCSVCITTFIHIFHVFFNCPCGFLLAGCKFNLCLARLSSPPTTTTIPVTPPCSSPCPGPCVPSCLHASSALPIISRHWDRYPVYWRSASERWRKWKRKLVFEETYKLDAILFWLLFIYLFLYFIYLFSFFRYYYLPFFSNFPLAASTMLIRYDFVCCGIYHKTGSMIVLGVCIQSLNSNTYSDNCFQNFRQHLIQTVLLLGLIIVAKIYLLPN